jgi:SAM-dependent methyltransferase
MQSKIKLKDEEKIKCKMMDYAHTDFESGYFDLIYAQGSICIPERKDIIKEIKRILNSDGTVCTGEVVSLK